MYSPDFKGMTFGNDSHIRAVFIAESPLQLLGAWEARVHLGLEPHETLLLAPNMVAPRAELQLRNVIKLASWPNVVTPPATMFMGRKVPVAHQVRERKWLLALADRYRAQLEFFIFGEYRSLRMRLFARELPPSVPRILVDDGLATLLVANDRYSITPSSFGSPRIVTRGTRARTALASLVFGTHHPAQITYFTFLDVQPGPMDTVTKHSFEGVRSVMATDRDIRVGDEVWVVGQPLVELGTERKEAYWASVGAFARRYRDRTVKYVPHRREDPTNYQPCLRQIEVEELRIDEPLETYVLKGQAPAVAVGFTSTALFSLRKLSPETSVGSLYDQDYAREHLRAEVPDYVRLLDAELFGRRQNGRQEKGP